MALLQTACVNIGEGCEDVCLNYNSGVFCDANKNGCGNCLSKNDGRSDCVLLGGISSAKHLELISELGKFIFTRDLKCCPTFSKLKTLLLNEYWCEAPDLDPLACILQNSPVLEKLTLQLFSKGPDHKVEMKGSYTPMEGPSAISEHLNMVEVKCNVVDEKILKVLKLLSAFNIHGGSICGGKLGGKLGVILGGFVLLIPHILFSDSVPSPVNSRQQQLTGGSSRSSVLI
uniref:Uncharacterized protein n=1 Tax=Aegilops tauschii TaxID=37682 RepID=R7W8H6_AEGTA